MSDVGGTVSMNRVKVDARAHEIADELIGTARSKHDAMTQEEIDDPTLEAALNDLVFECDCCGWWASTDELHNLEDANRQLCDECHEEEFGEGLEE